MIVDPSDAEVQNLAANIQRSQQVQQMTNTVVLSTAQMIYSQVIAQVIMAQAGISPEEIRNIAAMSREMAPYLAESFGLVKVHTKEEADDAV